MLQYCKTNLKGRNKKLKGKKKKKWDTYLENLQFNHTVYYLVFIRRKMDSPLQMEEVELLLKKFVKEN